MMTLGTLVSRERTRDQMPFQPEAGSDVVDHVDHPMVQGFADLWNSKRTGGGLPQRADFTTEDFLPWFGHVLMLDVVEGGADFRYRLIGTHITNFMNRDLSTRLVSQCDYAGARDNGLDSLRRPLVYGRPVFRSGRVVWSVDQSERSYTSVHCPLSNSCGAPEMTIGVVYFS